MSQKFPPAYRRMSPVAKLSWLSSDCCRAMVAAGKLQGNQIEAEKRRINRDHQRIAPTTPTPAWSAAYRAGEPFPPVADDPACQMVHPTQALHFSELSQWFPSYYVTNAGKTFEVAMLENDELMELLDMANVCHWGMPSRDRTPKVTIDEYRQHPEIDFSGPRPRLKNPMPLPSEDRAVIQQQLARQMARRAGKAIAHFGCVKAAVERAERKSA